MMAVSIDIPRVEWRLETSQAATDSFPSDNIKLFGQNSNNHHQQYSTISLRPATEDAFSSPALNEGKSSAIVIQINPNFSHF